MTTLADARAEILGQFTTKWAVAFPAYPVYSEDWVNGPKPAITTPYARIIAQHEIGDNDTIVGHLGNALFFRSGYVTVTLFAPTGQGLLTLDRMAQVALDSYEGKRTASGVWFRRTRYIEQGTYSGWHQGQVISDFNYTEAK